MKDLKGKTVVITGGATGIGLAIALALVKEGSRIVIASTNQEKLDAGVKEITEAGGEAMSVVCNVAERASVQNLFDTVTKEYGPTDILIANAGVTTGGEFVKHREQDWSWVYDVVLGGVTNCVQIFYPEMVKRGSGHIVLTGSQAGMVPDWFTEHGPYTSAKAAVHALGAALRPEAEWHGVSVTTVIVAGVSTDIMKSERSRPEKYGDAGPKTEKRRVARRISPGTVAKLTVDGIKNNQAWVATHPDLKPVTKDYFDRILAAYDHDVGLDERMIPKP